jgi:hypothetical protein
MSRICVKVGNLRKHGYQNLEEWLECDDNLYVGRHGRIFIKYPDNERRIFHYKASKWCNPFRVKEHCLDECIRMYEEYIQKSDMINDIDELKNKNLGCWCDETSQCHVDVLLKLLEDEDKKIANTIEDNTKCSGVTVRGIPCKKFGKPEFDGRCVYHKNQ